MKCKKVYGVQRENCALCVFMNCVCFVCFVYECVCLCPVIDLIPVHLKPVHPCPSQPVHP